MRCVPEFEVVMNRNNRVSRLCIRRYAAFHFVCVAEVKRCRPTASTKAANSIVLLSRSVLALAFQLNDASSEI